MKKRLYSALCILCCFLILLGCSKKVSEKTSDPKFAITDTFQRYIKIDTVKEQQVFSKLSLTGKVSFDENEVVRLFPLTGGQIVSLNVELGDYVKKGQTLAVIRSLETADYANQLVQAESNVEMARKNLEVAESSYQSGLISEKELLSSKSDLKKAAAELERARSITSLMGEATGKSYTMKAPVSGYIVEKNATHNMEFRGDNSPSLFTIANLDKVYVIANVFESDINHIKEGYDAKVSTLSYPGKVFHGKIDKIYNVIDPDQKVMKVRIKLVNPDVMLKPEMFANVEVNFPEDKVMNYIPSTAVIFDKNNNFAMIYHRRDSIETREIQVYKSYSGSTYITTGLKKGEHVISRNALLVYDALND